jgi:hypothetical protein
MEKHLKIMMQSHYINKGMNKMCLDSSWQTISYYCLFTIVISILILPYSWTYYM